MKARLVQSFICGTGIFLFSSASFGAIPAFYCSIGELRALGDLEGLAQALRFESILSVQSGNVGYIVHTEHCHASVSLEYIPHDGEARPCPDFKMTLVGGSICE